MFVKTLQINFLFYEITRFGGGGHTYEEERVSTAWRVVEVCTLISGWPLGSETTELPRSVEHSDWWMLAVRLCPHPILKQTDAHGTVALASDY